MNVIEFLRYVLWSFIKIALFIIDWCWEVAKIVVGLDFSNQPWIWKWYYILIVFFILFLTSYIYKIAFKSYFENDYVNKINFSNIILKLFISIFLFFFTPIAIKGVTNFASELSKNITVFTDSKSSKLSTLIVDSSSIDFSLIDQKYQSQGDLLKDKLKVANSQILSKEDYNLEIKKFKEENSWRSNFGDLYYEKFSSSYDKYVEMMKRKNENEILNGYWATGDVSKINVNDGEESGEWYNFLIKNISLNLFSGGVQKAYYHFPTLSSLFFVLIFTIAFVWIFFGILISLAQRLYSLILKMFLAPYSFASLIDPESNAFKTWFKYVLSDLITNWFQLYSMMVLFAFVGGMDKMLSNSTNLGMFAKLVLILGGLLAVYTAPSGVAAIIGGDQMSSAESLRQLVSMKNTTSSIKAGLTTAGAGVLLAGGKAGFNALKGFNIATRGMSAGANFISNGKVGTNFSDSRGALGKVKDMAKATAFGGAFANGFKSYNNSNGTVDSGGYNNTSPGTNNVDYGFTNGQNYSNVNVNSFDSSFDSSFQQGSNHEDIQTLDRFQPSPRQKPLKREAVGNKLGKSVAKGVNKFSNKFKLRR